MLKVALFEHAKIDNRKTNGVNSSHPFPEPKLWSNDKEIDFDESSVLVS